MDRLDLDQETYWNGEPCQVRRVAVIVGRAPLMTWWCAELEGQERVVLEVSGANQAGGTFYLEDDSAAAEKLTAGRGMPTCGHRSLPVARIMGPPQVRGAGSGEGFPPAGGTQTEGEQDG